MMTCQGRLSLFITLMLAAIAQTAHADNPALPPGSDLPTRQEIVNQQMEPLLRAKLILHLGKKYWDTKYKRVVWVHPPLGSYTNKAPGGIRKNLHPWHEVKLKIKSQQFVPYRPDR
ncbi:MAG: hypothetical protein N0E59_02295 [Candidatus Thiodiazotropha taylori]|nr:hypothetical protein [Candidatus Thiodiazotropha taylori]MCG8051932.1 hypothetical protein [Candidatus Thiodiazotropha taylori]MCG8109570.1 hypothetical protein [Candidatus Thiodiazotropha taylori]MCW4281914.1 hypothetical protein [Candidatus Thiodiazotropha taylori]MCW4306100.1 hypothetical protein [Candidatus Thiodiazotropha taylori]